MKTIFLFACLLITTQNVFANEKLDELCIANAYYAGAKNYFMSGIANTILFKTINFKEFTKVCGSVHEKAFLAGERLSRGGNVLADDVDYLQTATAFSEKIYVSIAKGAGYL